MTRIAMALVFALALAVHAAADTPVPRPGDVLHRIDYLYGVAVECGLADDAVTAGYFIVSEGEVARLGLTGASRRHVRIGALIAVDLEWGNRGLGGHRSWCRTEGADAASLFRAIAAASGP
jgi:hypothetical protein